MIEKSLKVAAVESRHPPRGVCFGMSGAATSGDIAHDRFERSANHSATIPPVGLAKICKNMRNSRK